MGALMLVLLLAAAVCFALAAANMASRINLLGLGLLLWVITALIPAIQAV
jgi:hypothetical protein